MLLMTENLRQEMIRSEGTERQLGVDLTLQRVIQSAVLVTEVDRRVPHLKIEVGCPRVVKEVAAVATRE